MKFYLYSTYDPEVESFDSRIQASPLEPKMHGEQCRRAFIKMDEKDQAFMDGKKVYFLAMFDDETGKIEQVKLVEAFHFMKAPKPDVKSEDNQEEVKNA